MESNRLQKVNQLLQEELAEIFRKEAAKIKLGMLITVTEVRTTPDLSIAKVYLSIFPTLYRDEVLKYVDMHQATFRKQLGNQIGKQLRVVPELHYYSDESLEKIDEIDKALKGKGDNPIL